MSEKVNSGSSKRPRRLAVKTSATERVSIESRTMRCDVLAMAVPLILAQRAVNLSVEKPSVTLM